MSVIDFRQLDLITVKLAEESIAKYCAKYGVDLDQFNHFYNITRVNESPDQRMISLLEIVRYDGWQMNRKRQCEGIIRDIRSKKILYSDLVDFWQIVDQLPKIDLRDLKDIDDRIFNQLKNSLTNIRETLLGWHPSARTLTFLTKVILMFNWGQSPAFDTRIRGVLKVRPDLSDKELVQSLGEIGSWISNFESENGIKLDKFASAVMMSKHKRNLHPLPSGRAFDMMLFSLFE